MFNVVTHSDTRTMIQYGIKSQCPSLLSSSFEQICISSQKHIFVNLIVIHHDYKFQFTPPSKCIQSCAYCRTASNSFLFWHCSEYTVPPPSWPLTVPYPIKNLILNISRNQRLVTATQAGMNMHLEKPENLPCFEWFQAWMHLWLNLL